MHKKIYSNPLIKIIAGIIIIGGIVFLVQWVSGFFPEKLTRNNGLFNLLVALIQCFLAVRCYIALYSYFEKRPVSELSGPSFLPNAAKGFLTGVGLQSLIILVLYLAGGYIITRVNPASFMVPAFISALTAGFVAEILIRGILFRLLEEKLGTAISIGIMMLFFMVMHLGGKGATLLSVLSVSIQAGFLLSAVYVLTRNLWFPIFLHFAWDFAEPGIFGAINPGNSVGESLFTSHISGSNLLTGGAMGPVNSFQSLLLCFLAGSFFLWLAWKQKRFIFPFRKKRESLMMKHIFLLLICGSILHLSISQTVTEKDFSSIFKKYGVDGCFILYDEARNSYIRYNSALCDSGYIPASTFKIPNSLIALEEGIIKDTSEVIRWDGHEWPNQNWNRDQTLKTAIKYSCVWVYVGFAEKIGIEKYAAWLKSFDYGNQDLTGPPDRFWLSGPYRISANQQIDFLRKFYYYSLPVSRRSIDIVRELIVLEKTDSWKLSGKTGTGLLSDKDYIMWLVGYLEKNNKPCFFAMNFKTSDFDGSSKARFSIVKDIFRELKLIE